MRFGLANLLILAGCLVAICASAGSPDSDCWRRSEIEKATHERSALEQIEAARRRIAARPEQAAPRAELGMILYAYESFAVAQVCYEEAARLDPESPRWHYYLARVLSWNGDDEGVLRAIDRVLEDDPNNHPAQLLRAETLFRSGRLGASERAWREALRRRSDSAHAHYGLGQTLAARGLHDQAAQSFERAVELLPHYAQARYALAIAYRRIGEAEKAQREIEAHARLGQAPPPLLADPWMEEVHAKYRGARSHVARGSLAARAGRAEEAIAEFQLALEMNPKLVVAHSNLINLYSEAERFDKAEEHYRLAIAISGNWAEAHANWGGALLRQGRLDEASATLRKAIYASPHFAEARVQLGLTFDELGRAGAAAEQYRLALDSNPLHPHAHYLLGRSLLRAGRPEEGLDELQKAIDVGDRRTAAYLDALVRVHEAEGNLDLALGYARRALARARKDGLAELIAPLKKSIARLEARLEEQAK